MANTNNSKEPRAMLWIPHDESDWKAYRDRVPCSEQTYEQFMRKISVFSSKAEEIGVVLVVYPISVAAMDQIILDTSDHPPDRPDYMLAVARAMRTSLPELELTLESLAIETGFIDSATGPRDRQ